MFDRPVDMGLFPLFHALEESGFIHPEGCPVFSQPGKQPRFFKVVFSPAFDTQRLDCRDRQGCISIDFGIIFIEIDGQVGAPAFDVQDPEKAV
jgi:hypothetical protein